MAKKARELRPDTVNVLAELERLGWGYEAIGDDEVKVRCPSHDDSQASMSMNIRKGLCKCHASGCGWGGDIVSFMAMALKSTRRVIIEDLSSRYDLVEDRTIDSSVVEQWHAAVWGAKHLLKELYNRGLDDEDVRTYRIGFANGRLTIPIKNEYGRYVNVRKYLPGAPGADKMKNVRGRGKIRLFPIDQLKYDEIIVCGGELKTIATARRLNQHGIGAISATAGEGNWEASFSRLLRGKRVWVCMDVDEGGMEGAERVAARIKGDAGWVGVVKLPLDTDKWPTGDLNDYWASVDRGGYGGEVDAFLNLLQGTPRWEPRTRDVPLDESPVEDVSVADATAASRAGKRLRVRGVIAAIDSNPYLVPKRVRCDCDKNQPFCAICPVFASTPQRIGSSENEVIELVIPPDSSSILGMVNASKDTQHDCVREGLRIPPCKSVSFKAVEHYNVEDVRVTPDLDITSDSTEERMLPIFSISHGLEGNTVYAFDGRVYPHPRTQKAILLASSSKPAEDALSQYRPTDEELEVLTLFQPAEWTMDGLQQKFDDLYTDLEANITRIFQRRSLHVMVDLAYHSALLLRFDKRIEKGWAEVLIVGDSAQGKSETTRLMQRHYGLGEKVESKNASAAGLLGGLQPLGGRWFVTWGKIPLNDRRLVILEELKGASTETISKLTDMRSSGVAEIDKIEKRRTHARTRLIALSNPRGDAPIAAYSYGVEAIRELIGGPEDIRRFDAALIVSSQQIDATQLNRLQRQRPQVPHRHTSDLCRRCVLFAWTRKPDQIEFTEEASEAVLAEATRMCAKYSDAIPLVDRGSMRLKLARLSVALAARTFSTGQSRQVLVVRGCHVQYVAHFLDTTYGDPVFGYGDFSEAYMSTRKIRDTARIESTVAATPYPHDLIENLLHTDRIELRDICDWCGWERGEATELLSFFVRNRALTRDGRAYRKNPQFIALLKTMRDKIEDRPDYIPDSREDF